jgi:antitoxin (DNA-binding transcriptional repressor) of toxin-antitoxin stability system
MAAIHVSEAEALRTFSSLLERARAGTEIVIEADTSPSVILRASQEPQVRCLSESLRLAREHKSSATLDGDFAADLCAAIDSHLEPLQSSWE